MPPLPPPLADLIVDTAMVPVLAGEAGATVLRLTSPDATVRYLKYGGGTVGRDIADEAARLSWLNGRLPCPDIVHFIQHGDAVWLLTTAVPGRTADSWLETDPARLDAIVHGCATFLLRLHALPVADCPFDASAAVRLAAARRNVVAGFVDTDDFNDDHDGWTAEQVWDQVIRLRPAGGDRVITHGDFSLGNLLLDESGRVTGVIDVGRLGVADPYQDIAIFWQNLSDFGAGAQRRFVQLCGAEPPDERRLLFHRCLDELF